jgi:hypothetical protein
VKHVGTTVNGIRICVICKVRYACLEAQREIMKRMGYETTQGD